MDFNKAALEMHETHHGKVRIVSKVDDIVERIQKLEREIADSLNTLFHKEG